MSPEQLEELRLTRAELAALRTSIRREQSDLWILTLDVTGATTPGRDGIADDPTPAALSYAHYNVQLADRALSTALDALRPLLATEEDAC